MTDVYVHVTIAGITPLLCNRFTEAAQQSASSSSRSALVGSKGTPREQAAPKLYKDNNGVIGLPQPNIMACIVCAGKFFKAGKSKLTTLKSSLIPACVAIEGVMLPLEFPRTWEVDTRPVRIPSTGGRILAHRPRFDEWSVSFVAVVDTSLIDVKLFREVVDAAGKRIGLGDFRPDRKGPFGRFKVTRWEVTDEPVADAAE